MTKFRGAITLVVLILFCSGMVIGQSQRGARVQSLPSILDQINSLWQTYQDPKVNISRTEKIAEQILELKNRTGMINNTGLANAFAMKAWHHKNLGELNAAYRDMRIAVELAPDSREIKSGLAAVMAARNPLNLFSYMPIYFDSFFGSLSTASGWYHFVAEFSLILGSMLIILFSAWGLSMLLRYFLATYHAIAEMLAMPFGFELSVLITAVVLAVPLVFQVPIFIYFFGLVLLTLGFQNKTEQIITIIVALLVIVGFSAIDLSANISLGLTDPKVQAGFIAEHNDANYSLVNGMEYQIRQNNIIRDNEFRPDLTDEERLSIFLYANGLRKLGQERGFGRDLTYLYDHITGNDSIGMRARINAANIRLERNNIRAAMQEYELALENNEARPFALYNLWRLHYSLRNVNKANDYMNLFTAEYPDMVRTYNIGDQEIQPELLDAGLTRLEITHLINRGLMSSADSLPQGQSAINSIFLDSLTSFQSLIYFIIIAAMFVVSGLLRFFGIAVSCKKCGLVYCHVCNVDPKASRVCRSCGAITSGKGGFDAELQRRQKEKQNKFAFRKQVIAFLTNLVAAGSGNIYSGKTVLGLVSLVFWSLFAAIFYSIGRMPRLESMPFFSHWSGITVTLVIICALVAYPLAFWMLFISEKQNEHGAGRKP